MQDPELLVEQKPLARDGGQEGAYRDIWFTFNDEYSWAQSAFEIQEGRISKNRTLTKDEVLAPLRDVLTSIARDEIEKFLRKMNVHIED